MPTYRAIRRGNSSPDWYLTRRKGKPPPGQQPPYGPKPKADAKPPKPPKPKP
jgi:hypothetical protein